ncbi:hypothetical protein GDO81_019122 [Engystomops pustulosus]|uniref:Uncharacterized protein n=1 Tax=Engystomops pustulosus TaxID=76066 RepID=A0AAV6YIM1_ENGPU|nr:hypothetical protein GDO81_019122 [Engystomops pustulosus]
MIKYTVPTYIQIQLKNKPTDPILYVTRGLPVVSFIFEQKKNTIFVLPNSKGYRAECGLVFCRISYYFGLHTTFELLLIFFYCFSIFGRQVK